MRHTLSQSHSWRISLDLVNSQQSTNLAIGRYRGRESKGYRKHIQKSIIENSLSHRTQTSQIVDNNDVSTIPQNKIL